MGIRPAVFSPGVPLVIAILVLAALSGALLWWGYRPDQWNQPIIRRTGMLAGLAAAVGFVLAVWASFNTDTSEFARRLLSDWFG